MCLIEFPKNYTFVKMLTEYVFTQCHFMMLSQDFVFLPTNGIVIYTIAILKTNENKFRRFNYSISRISFPINIYAHHIQCNKKKETREPRTMLHVPNVTFY